MRVRYIGPKGNTIGTTELVDGKVVSTGVGEEDERLVVIQPGDRKKGIPIRRLTPADGDVWLRGLGEMCRSGFITAVLEDS